MEITIMQMILAMLSLACVVAATLLFIGREKLMNALRSIQSSRNQQMKFGLEVSDPKRFRQVLKIIPKLSMVEKEAVIQQLFRRPIRICRGLDRDGTSWLEWVCPFEVDIGAEANFHMVDYLDRQEKKGRSHIG